MQWISLPLPWTTIPGAAAWGGNPGDGHSPLAGFALDGFGIFGSQGEDGETLATEDLDACHGHAHAIPWNGGTETLYHYHFTDDYPYTLGCFRGMPGSVTED